MAPPKAVLFDVDGTLVDPVDLRAHAWLDTFRHFGAEAELDGTRLQIGKGGDQLLPGLVPPALLAAKSDEVSAFQAAPSQREDLPQVWSSRACAGSPSASTPPARRSCWPPRARLTR